MTGMRDVTSMVRRYGGVLVSPEFLGPDGTATMRLGPQLVVDLLVGGDRLVYERVGGSRIHWQVGGRVVRDWDALVVFEALRNSRLVIEPARSAEHRERIDAWRRGGHGSLGALQERLDELRAATREPSRRPRASRDCLASWHARLNDAGLLDTCGAAVLGARRLVYVSLDGGATRDLRLDFAEGHRRRRAADLFSDLIATGNGESNEWSRPFTLAAPSIEVAAARLVTRHRFRDDLAGHLRELWLAGLSGAVEDAAMEAEAVIEGCALDERAAAYLARLRAAARTRSGRHRAASRSTRGGAPRGRPRRGGDHAS